MSDRTAEISASVTASASEISELADRVEQLAEEARAKYETAAMHGWGGVAANMSTAVEYLEALLTQIHAAHDSCENTSATLDEITDKMSSPDVVAHLMTALGSIESATTSLQGGNEALAQASGSCQAAGVEYLAGQLSEIGDELDAVAEKVTQSRGDIDSERMAAEAYAAAVADESGSGSSGN